MADRLLTSPQLKLIRMGARLVRHRLTLPLSLALSRSKLRGYANSRGRREYKTLDLQTPSGDFSTNARPLGKCQIRTAKSAIYLEKRV